MCPEDDAPRSRKHEGTQFERNRTQPHRGADTNQIPAAETRDPRLREGSSPIKLVREPTELIPGPYGIGELPEIDAPVPRRIVVPDDPQIGGTPRVIVDPKYQDRGDDITRKVRSDPQPAAGTLDITGEHGVLRTVQASMFIMQAVDVLSVDRRPLTAQFVRGVAEALVSAMTTGSLEYVGGQITQRLLLADAGVGMSFGEEQIGETLLHISASVLAGVEPRQRTASEIAKNLEDRGRAHRHEARTLLERAQPGDLDVAHRAAQAGVRAEECELQAKALRENFR